MYISLDMKVRGAKNLENPFWGKWAYRSFLRDPDLSVEFNDLRFGVGNLELEQAGVGLIRGSLGGTGWSLALSGSCTFGTPNRIRFKGEGVIGEEVWIYDYLGYLAEPWPNGIGEIPSLVGTIVRTAAHSNGKAEAGFVASWVAVQQS